MNTLEDFFDYYKKERPSEISIDEWYLLIDLIPRDERTTIKKQIEKIRRANEVIQKTSYLKYGLCSRYKGYAYIPTSYLATLWPKFSGSRMFPVPSPIRSRTPQWAYENLPKYTGEYGALRKELSQFMSDYAIALLTKADDLVTEYNKGKKTC